MDKKCNWIVGLYTLIFGLTFGLECLIFKHKMVSFWIGEVFFALSTGGVILSFILLEKKPCEKVSGISAVLFSNIYFGLEILLSVIFAIIPFNAKWGIVIEIVPLALLVKKYRNARMWNILQQIQVMRYLVRLPYLITAEEATKVFQVPVDNKKIVGIQKREIVQNVHLIDARAMQEDNIQIGKIYGIDEIDDEVGCTPKYLTRHALVVGMPGTGKTTFSVRLLLQVYRKGIPFLAIEPTKSEYRAMIDAIPELQIFTPGNNGISPFVINPFIPPRGITIEQYIPSLASAFKAAFSMPSPLDTVFQQAIREAYVQYGWKDYSTAQDDDVGEDEEDINDGNGVKTLTREITPEIIDSRERDTEETLQNYRENLEERGVSSEQIDAFINEQRERIYDEYDSLDQGEATKNIYEMPQNWDEVAQNLNNSELYGNNIEYEETITEEQMDEDLSYVEGLPEVEESEERSEGNLELDNSSEAEETLGHEELDNMPENSDLREEPFVHDANEGIDITGDETSEDVEGVEDIPEIDYEEIYNQLNQEALNQGFEEINIYEDVERLDSLLNNFETENWESISLPEQKHAIDELAHYVEDVIGFQNTPTIEYYNNPQEGDYGGYNVATNTLSINEYMLYNSEEAADTVAHELWHAHQGGFSDLVGEQNTTDRTRN